MVDYIDCESYMHLALVIRCRLGRRLIGLLACFGYARYLRLQRPSIAWPYASRRTPSVCWRLFKGSRNCRKEYRLDIKAMMDPVAMRHEAFQKVWT